MRTWFYWPWEWTARVWVRMAGAVAWVAAIAGFNMGFTELEHYLLREYGIAYFWGYAPYLWAVGFVIGFSLAINWAVDSIGIAEEEAKKRFALPGLPARR